MIIRVVDVETCGLPPDNAQIVEVATVDLVLALTEDDSEQWCRGRMWSSLVNPGRPIPPEISAIHHITDEMVADKWRFTDALVNIYDGEPDLFAAHNARFEIACAKVNEALPVQRPDGPVPNALYVPLSARRWICTYKCALSAWPDAPMHSNQALRYWLRLKLADEAGPPHRALGDAYVTAAILRRLLAANTLEQLLAVSARPALLPRFTFGKHAMLPINQVPTDYLSWITTGMKDADEDVLYTARTHIAQRRQAAQQRSPV